MRSTYSFEDIFFSLDEWVPKGRIQVRTLFTRVDGRCYLIEPDQDVKFNDYIRIPMKNMSSLKFYVLDTKSVGILFKNPHKRNKTIIFQDLCLIVGFCEFALKAYYINGPLATIYMVSGETRLAPR